MRISLALLVVLSAVVASACALRGDDNASGGLANTAWTVVTIGGAPTIDDAQPTMAFSPEGVVSGTNGCNTYSGPYRTEGDQITVGALASTLIGCDGQIGAQEGAFMAGLSGATTWRQTADGNLELVGVTAIVAEPDGPDGPPETIPPASLSGNTAWAVIDGTLRLDGPAPLTLTPG